MSDWFRRRHDVDKEGYDERHTTSHSAQLPNLTGS
jgi:hypothetical protein